ncbi:hypothetical protein HanRHA438_Chr03g0114201 [Helianthus annuus]|nr:hypothetical protein HanRHA438_Chr03g0114201 [Helianthus annuus]
MTECFRGHRRRCHWASETVLQNANFVRRVKSLSTVILADGNFQRASPMAQEGVGDGACISYFPFFAYLDPG